MFFWSDTLGTLFATLLFAFVLLIPGFVVAFSFDLFGFRKLNTGWQIISAICLSFAVVPLAGYLLLRFGGMPAVWPVLLLTTGIFLWKQRPATLTGFPKNALLLTLAWVIIGILMLADMQFGTKVYFCATAIDHEFRVAVIDAITRTGLPPASPFNHIDGPVVMRYHFYWFGLCSIVERLSFGLLTARHALNGSILWCGFGLMSLVALATRFFLQTPPDKLLRRTLIGVALIGVTGLDLLPNLLDVLNHTAPPDDMEWWSPDQITSWADAILWVPHHVAGIIAGITGFVLLFWCAETIPARIACAVIAGAAFASATGCSIYVGFALAVALAAWTITTLLRKWHRHTILLAASGLAAVLLSLPNILQLRGAEGGGGFLALGLHYSLNSAIWLQALNIPEGPLFRLLQLPFLAGDYFLELGLFFVIGIVQLRRFLRERTWGPVQTAAVVMSLSALLLCTFVRSTTIGSNDLGWRGFMIVQFILLLWAAELLDAPLASVFPRPGWVHLAFLLLLVGAAGSIYQLAWLRFDAVVTDTGIFGDEEFDTHMGTRTYSLRRLYEKLDTMLPPDAIVQGLPDLHYDYWEGLYSHRQTVSTGDDCTVAMGGKLNSCNQALPELKQIFDPSISDPELIRKIARKYQIRAIIVSDDDPVWNKPESWTSHMKPAVVERDAKAFLF